MLEIIVCLSCLLLYLYLTIEHFPKQKVSDSEELIRLIRENGLIHYTSLCNAEPILKNGLLPCKKKKMSFFEKDFTWCYIYDENKNYTDDAIFQKNKNSKKDNERKCEVGIHIENITDEQINRMRYHKKRGYVAYKGILKTDKMSVITL